MTLILACLTNDTVYQVSDRRLTSFEPPRSPIDDESNKAVFVNGRVVFGYTGISHVAGERCDTWLAKTIAANPSGDMAKIAAHIRQQATLSFRSMSFASRYKRHAFQAVGWFSDPEGTSLSPGVLTIHNALSQKTGDWLPYARHEFEVNAEFPKFGKHQFLLRSVGLLPTLNERGAVYQLVRKCVKRRADRPRAILEALVRSVRWLSSRYEPNSPIGKSLMAVCLPKASAEQSANTGHFLAASSEPEPDRTTFLHHPEFEMPVRYGPIVVMGSSVISGFECGPIQHA